MTNTPIMEQELMLVEREIHELCPSCVVTSLAKRTDNPIGQSSRRKCEKSFPSYNLSMADHLSRQCSSSKCGKPLPSDHSCTTT